MNKYNREIDEIEEPEAGKTQNSPSEQRSTRSNNERQLEAGENGDFNNFEEIQLSQRE